MFIQPGIPIDIPFGSIVMTTRAVDPDGNLPTVYSITDIASQLATTGQDLQIANANTFLMFTYNGSIYTNELMTRYSGHFFEIDIMATDPALGKFGAAEVKVQFMRILLFEYFLYFVTYMNII